MLVRRFVTIIIGGEDEPRINKLAAVVKLVLVNLPKTFWQNKNKRETIGSTGDNPKIITCRALQITFGRAFDP